MKKLLLALGSIAAVAAPVASVVACGAPGKPAPKAIDETAAKKLAEKIVATITNNSGAVPTVKTQTDGNISIEFQMTGPDSKMAQMKIVITSTGKVVSANNGTPVKGDDLVQLETMVQAATVDHSHDSLPTFKIERDTSITAIMDKMTLSIPVLPTGADYDQTETFNGEVTAFQNQYDTKAVDVAVEILKTIDTTTLTDPKFTELQIGERDSLNNLDDVTIAKLGLTANEIIKVKGLAPSGVSITVTKNKDADLNMYISANSATKDINFGHGTATSGATMSKFAATA